MTREEVEELFDQASASVILLGHGCSEKKSVVDRSYEKTFGYQFWSVGNGKDTLMGIHYTFDPTNGKIKNMSGYYNDYHEKKHVQQSCNDLDTFYKKIMEWITWL